MAGPSTEVRGALNIILNGFCMVVGTAMIKHVAGVLPEPVVIAARHLVAVLCFAPLILAQGPAAFRTQRPFGHLWRAAFGLSGFFAFIYSVTHLKLSDAVALAFTQPIWSTLMAAAVFGERLGVVRFAAVLGGFGGVLLIAKPTRTFEPMMLVGLAGALLTSIAMGMVKNLGQTEPAERIAFWFLLMATGLWAVPAAGVWTPIPLATLPWLLAIGLLAWFGQIALSRGYQLGRFSTMATMDFIRLPLSVIVGLIAFSEVPDVFSVLGMLIIATASLVIVNAAR
jgi:drug/metabolite transporter (DMT)-like permease